MNDLKRFTPVAIIVAGLAAAFAMSDIATQSIDPAKQAYAGATTSWCFALEPASVKPTPAVKPKPGDPCPDCNGKGEVGDGSVFRDCKSCNGTGRVPGNDDDDGDTESEPEGVGPSTGSEAVHASQSRDDLGDALECSDGSCGSGRTRRGLFGGFFRRR